jgi:two-component system sensor histidine kinase KdpD
MTTEPITHLRAEDLLEEPSRSPRTAVRGVGRRRQLTGLALAVVGLPLLTLGLNSLGSSLSLESDVLLYLLAVVAIALVGGVVVALASAFAAATLINYYFIRPFNSFEIGQGEQVLTLAVFFVVAAAVSGAIELAIRRARAAEHAARQAETLSELAGGRLDEDDSLTGVLERARSTFGMESVALRERDRAGGDWVEVEQRGWAAPGTEAPLRFDVPAGDHLRLIGRGRALFAKDQRVLDAFAAAAQTAYQGQRLSARARTAREFERADSQRTALLAGVGHDLRTPLASIKVSVSTLRQADVDWSATERDELLATIEESTDRLDSIVSNLLDASRLQAGALSVKSQPVALDEVIGAAVLAVPGATARVDVDVPEDLPLVQADPGLLERILANLLDNAVRHSGGGRVEVSAVAGTENAKLKVVDHGPGVPADQREDLFKPFERLGGEADSNGAGLGLTVARGFAEAMGGVLIADGSAGGGLTMRLRLPLAP